MGAGALRRTPTKLRDRLGDQRDRDCEKADQKSNLSNSPDSGLAGKSELRNTPGADLATESAVLVFGVVACHASIPSLGLRGCHERRQLSGDLPATHRRLIRDTCSVDVVGPASLNVRVRHRPVLLGLAVAIVLGGGIYLVVSRGSSPPRQASASTTTTTATEASREWLSGLSLSVVRRQLGRHGEAVTVELRAPSSYRPGTVESGMWRSPWSTDVVVSSGPPENVKAALVHATGRPVHSECDAPIQLTQDGNVTPLLCGGVHVDVGAWDFYSTTRPALFGLGRSATRCQVVEAMEGLGPGSRVPDVEGVTYPEEYSTFQLAQAYYGWRFTLPFPGLNPPTWLPTCGVAGVRAWTG